MSYTGRRKTPLPADWQSIRAHVLRRDKFCMWGSIPSDGVDYAFACSRVSTEVDHTGDADDHRLAFLRGLCHYHHAIRTGRQGAAGKAAVMRTRKRPEEPHPAYRRNSD